jgi:HEAT repeat protein
VKNRIVLPLVLVLVAGCGRDHQKDYSVAAMIQDLKHPDPDVRYTATEVLGKYGPEAKEAVPALIQALKDPNRNVRIGATYALAELGADAKDAVPALKTALKDREKDVRDGAAYSLKRIQGAK